MTHHRRSRQLIHRESTRLCIGLPVYNGDNFVAEALETILSQTFQDFRLIISDNGSTDQTERICRRFLEKDSRVQYFRNDWNKGAAANFNRVFALSNSEYFKWITHDDTHEPDFLIRCIEALDADPTAVVAHTRAITIDSSGGLIGEWGSIPELSSLDPRKRLRASLRKDGPPLPIFGVIRSDVLRKTRLFQGDPGCDRDLLSELSLHGRFHETDEALFVFRDHALRASPRLVGNPVQAALFWNPKQKGKLKLLQWRRARNYLRAISHAPLTNIEKLRCYMEVLEWMKRSHGKLLQDLIRISYKLPVIGQRIEKNISGNLRKAWQQQVDLLVHEIDSVVPKEAVLILVDGGHLKSTVFPQRQVLPFLERKGKYWGLPADDEIAIAELERLRRSGAGFIAFPAQSFWWFTHYKGFMHFLESAFSCLSRTDRLVVFDMSRTTDSFVTGGAQRDAQ